MSEAALALSLFLHIAATVIWIGGILLITFLVAPELHKRALAEQPALHQPPDPPAGKRFTIVGNLALAVLHRHGLIADVDRSKL